MGRQPETVVFYNRSNFGKHLCSDHPLQQIVAVVNSDFIYDDVLAHRLYRVVGRIGGDAANQAFNPSHRNSGVVCLWIYSVYISSNLRAAIPGTVPNHNITIPIHGVEKSI